MKFQECEEYLYWPVTVTMGDSESELCRFRFSWNAFDYAAWLSNDIGFGRFVTVYDMKGNIHAKFEGGSAFIGVGVQD